MARRDYGVVLAGGQASLSGKIFRIGHLGLVDDRDLEEAVDAVTGCLERLREKPVPAKAR